MARVQVFNPKWGSQKYYYMESGRKIYVNSGSQWNQSGEGGGNAALYYDEVKKEEPKPEPKPERRSEPARSPKPKPEPEPEEAPSKEVEEPVTDEEIDAITPEAEGLEDTIIDDPDPEVEEEYEPPEDYKDYSVKPIKNDENKSYLTRKSKRKSGSYLTR